jgi:hypothetical protein
MNANEVAARVAQGLLAVTIVSALGLWFELTLIY